MFIKSHMDDKQTRKIQDEVTALLDANRLKQAIDMLGTEIDSLQDWDIRTRYNEMQTAYKYMLEYMRMDMQDPGRERLYDELVGRCYIINDLIATSRESEHSTKVYSQKCRRYKTLESIDPILAAKPVTRVKTGAFIAFIMSYIANPEKTSPPGELIITVIGFS